MKTYLLFYFAFFLGPVVAAPSAISNSFSQKIDAMESIYTIKQVQQNQAASDNTTENGLSGSCKSATVLFAKGTGENGNVGDGSSPGPALFAELRKYMGEENISVQGIPYSADVWGFIVGGDSAGSRKLLDLTNEAVAKCPDSKIVISGYSQGAQLIHNAAKEYSADVTSRIHAVVLFGDPDLNEKVGAIPSSEILTICHDGDIICQGSGGADSHLTYSQDATKAATFITSKLISNRT